MKNTDAKSRAVDPLRKLAELWGIQTSYDDVRGQRCESPAESVLAVLNLLGSPVSRFDDIEEAVLEREDEICRQRVSPVVVAWGGGATEVGVRVPAAAKDHHFEASVDIENGEAIRWAGRLGELPDASPDECALVHRGVIAKRLIVPAALPLGYHRLSLQFASEQCETLIIAAPMRAYSPRGGGWQRSWGAFLPLYALESQQSWGAGDFRDLREQREWLQELGGQIVGTLPLLAAFLDEPFEISPYSPVSRLFWNEFFLNIPEVVGFSHDAEVRRVVETAEFRSELETARTERLVDYRRIAKLKRQALEKLAAKFFASRSTERTAFDSFVAAHPSLEDYAAFRALGERFRKPWSEWPNRLREGEMAGAEVDAAALRYHMFAQWQADEQIRRAANREGGSGLYLDMPLGVNASGYDVWRERSLFGVGATGGCPPDIMFPNGQNWGFVPLHPENIRRDGYRYIRQFLRHQMRYANVLRIDHMPSFHRVFWIPPGVSAKDGVYVRYPAEELYAVYALESHRHQTMIVGEDLGTVPPEVPVAMAKHNFHRMYVVQYEIQPDRNAALPEPPANSIASLNTHDMPPFAGFWNGNDIGERAHAGLLSPGECEIQERDRETIRAALIGFFKSLGYAVHGTPATAVLNACVEYLRDRASRMVLVNLEDLWQETLPQNIPSTDGENANWRRKARLTAEQFRNDPEIRRRLCDLSDAIANHSSQRHPAHV
ncbi:MAG: 4-alpha-glucanotransferase [Pirellulales bacterium]